MQNPYFFFDNPLIVNELMKQGIDIMELFKGAKDTQEAIDRLSAYVDKLDDTVRDEVTVQLQNMIDDGSLQAILNQISAYSAELPLNRKFRYIFANGRNTAGVDPIEADYAYYTQSACAYTTSNGNKKIAFIAPHYKNATTYMARLRTCNADGSNIHYTDVQTGHSNSITYLNGYFYVVEASRGDSASYYIHKIPASTGVISETKQMSIIGRGICAYNNKLYVTNATAIYEYDFANNTVQLVNTIPEEYRLWGASYMGFSDFYIDSLYYYIVTKNPNTILQFNRQTSELVKIINIPLVTNDYHHTGTVVSVSYDDVSGDISIFSNMEMQTTDYCQYVQFSYFYTNMFKGGVSQFTQTFTPSQYKTLHVDNTSTKLNPDGTVNNPFHYIQEAVNYACANAMFSSYIILLHNQTYYEYITMDTNKTIRIVNNTGEGEKSYVGGFNCYGTHISLDSLHLCSHLNQGNSNTNVLTLTNCIANIQRCTVRTTKISDNFRNCDYGINLYATDCLYYDVTNPTSGGNIFRFYNNSRVTETSGGNINAG